MGYWEIVVLVKGGEARGAKKVRKLCVIIADAPGGGAIVLSQLSPSFCFFPLYMM